MAKKRKAARQPEREVRGPAAQLRAASSSLRQVRRQITETTWTCRRDGTTAPLARKLDDLRQEEAKLSKQVIALQNRRRAKPKPYEHVQTRDRTEPARSSHTGMITIHRPGLGR